MNRESLAVLARLADGAWHSGDSLAGASGVGRAAVWKQVEALRQAGLPVHSKRGQGYRLDRSLTMLDADAIRAGLADPEVTVAVVDVVDSTNTAMAERGFVHRHALLAEYQTGGRGRRGRRWLAPPGCGLCLSFGFRFECGLQRLGALSLVAGVAAAEALREASRLDIGLKWPNDLLLDDRKLAGLLVEIRGASDGPCQVVIGLGVNWWLPETSNTPPDQPWTDLVGHGAIDVDRNQLAGRVIDALDRACASYQRDGFDDFHRRWQALDALAGRSVRVESGDGGVMTGTADGITARGGLWLRHGDDRVELSAGEVSIRVE